MDSMVREHLYTGPTFTIPATAIIVLSAMIHCQPSRIRPIFWEPSAEVHASGDWVARFHLNTGTLGRPKVENASHMLPEPAFTKHH
jgi:hypothetical protein